MPLETYERITPFKTELSCERLAIYSVGYIMLYSMAIALRGLSCAEAGYTSSSVGFLELQTRIVSKC